MHGSPRCTTDGPPSVQLNAMRNAQASAGNAVQVYLQRLRLETARRADVRRPQ